MEIRDVTDEEKKVMKKFTMEVIALMRSNFLGDDIPKTSNPETLIMDSLPYLYASIILNFVKEEYQEEEIKIFNELLKLSLTSLRDAPEKDTIQREMLS